VQGRWAILGAPPPSEPDAHAEQVAAQLLARWGVVFYDVLARENLALVVARDPPRAAAPRGARRRARRALRHRLHRRAVCVARCSRRAARGAADAAHGRARRASPRPTPLNLVGILTPGARVPAGGSETVTWCDGEALVADVRDAARA
jgi:ATP-dependent Lhr-like helicase